MIFKINFVNHFEIKFRQPVFSGTAFSDPAIRAALSRPGKSSKAGYRACRGLRTFRKKG